MSEVRRLITTHGALGRLAPVRPVAPPWESEPPAEIRYPGYIAYWDGPNGLGLYVWDGTQWVWCSYIGPRQFNATIRQTDGVPAGLPPPFEGVRTVTITNDDVGQNSFVLLDPDSAAAAFGGVFTLEEREGEFDIAWDDEAFVWYINTLGADIPMTLTTTWQKIPLGADLYSRDVTLANDELTFDHGGRMDMHFSAGLNDVGFNGSISYRVVRNGTPGSGITLSTSNQTPNQTLAFPVFEDLDAGDTIWLEVQRGSGSGAMTWSWTTIKANNAFGNYYDWDELVLSYVVWPLAASEVARIRVTTDGDTRVTTDGDRRVTEESI